MARNDVPDRVVPDNDELPVAAVGVPATSVFYFSWTSDVLFYYGDANINSASSSYSFCKYLLMPYI
ncbi:MAG: hypothetical protein ABI261_07895 [Ginsengibacter sp.]